MYKKEGKIKSANEKTYGKEIEQLNKKGTEAESCRGCHWLRTSAMNPQNN